MSAMLVCLTVLSGLSGSANASEIEDYADYVPQTSCAATAKPGTVYLLKWLVKRYPNTHASSTKRPCAGSSVSEHKDGRALDWGVDADRPAQRASADHLLARIFATDAAGNEHALARRMGIMYLIWNDHKYASYREFVQEGYLSSGCPSRRQCSKTLRHRDHVHFSLSHDGAAARTSFYTARNVPTS